MCIMIPEFIFIVVIFNPTKESMVNPDGNQQRMVYTQKKKCVKTINFDSTTHTLSYIHNDRFGSSCIKAYIISFIRQIDTRFYQKICKSYDTSNCTNHPYLQAYEMICSAKEYSYRMKNMLQLHLIHRLSINSFSSWCFGRPGN